MSFRTLGSSTISEVSVSRRLGRVGLSLVIAAGLATASGCKRDNDHASAVKQTAAKLHAVSGGGASGPFNSAQTQLLSKAQTEAQALAQSGRPAVASSGSLIAAETNLAKAKSGLNKFGQADRDVMNLTTGLRSMLARYKEDTSAAAAAAGFDPTARLAEINTAKGEKRTQIEARRKAFETINAEVTALRGQADAKLAAAKAEFDQAAGLMERAARESATQAATTVEQAAARRRAGDALQKEGLLFQARADTKAPEAAEATLYVQKEEAQLAGLEKTEAELKAKQAKQSQIVSETRASAAKIADEINERFTQIKQLRESAFKAAAEETNSALRAALGAAQKAQQDNPGPARLAIGTSQHAIANLKWRTAQAAGALADLADAMAAAEPALPQASSYKSDAEALRTEQKAAAEEAAAAYEAAKTAFTGVNIRGADKERLEKLGELLGKSGQVAGGEALDILGDYLAAQRAAKPRQPASTPTPAAPTPAPDADGIPADLTAFLDTYTAAVREGRQASIAATAFDATPEQLPNLQAGLRISDALIGAEKAAQAKFGQSLIAALSAAGGAASQVGGPDPAKAATLTTADLQVQLSGETATISGPGMQPQQVIKKDGAWKFQVPEGLTGPQAAAVVPMSAAMVKTFESIAADITSGTLPDLQSALQAIQQRLMQNLGAGGPGGG
jgi:hypothetical protein